MKSTAPLLNYDELSVLCWQMGRLCRAGIPWESTAELLLQDETDAHLRTVLEGMKAPLADGAPLDRAMRQTGAFPDYLLRMVEIGQASGRMEQVLAALAEYYKHESHTAAAMRRVVTYPAVMAALIGVVFLVLVWRVLPMFARVFADLGAGLSSTAGVLLGVSSAGRYIAVAMAALLLLGAAVLLITFRQKGAVPYLNLRVFSRGATALAVARGRFASAMALMLSSGLPLDEAFTRTEALLSDGPLADAVAMCRTLTGEGMSFPKAVAQSGIFSGMDAGLLASGFRTGASESAMSELAQRCDTESENRLTRLLARFEYGLVIVLCVSVGLVLLSVMLPLLGVLAAIGG